MPAAQQPVDGGHRLALADVGFRLVQVEGFAARDRLPCS